MYNTDYIYFDTETTKLLNKEDELTSFPYILGYTLGNGDFEAVWWTDIELYFLKKIEDMLRASKNKRITLAAFNAYYDISVVLPFFKKRWDGRINLFMDHRKKFIFGDYKLLLDGVEYTIDFEDYWLFNRNMSLDKWSEQLGEDTKPAFNYDKWGIVTREGERLHFKNYKMEPESTDLQEELIYLEHDVTILPKIREYIKKFKETIVSVAGVDEEIAGDLRIKPGSTCASFSKYVCGLKMYRNFDDTFRPTISEGVYRFYTRSFMGGYTVGNKYKFVVDCMGKYVMKGLDVNSMYPFIISEGLPKGRLWKKRKSITDIEWVVISTRDVQLKKKYDFLADLPIKQELNDGKPWVCTKRFYKVLCEVLDTDIKVHEYLYSNITTKISTMVKDLYKKRKEVGIDELTSFSIKILLNSLYGKTCEKTHEKHYILDNDGLTKIIEQNLDFRGILPGIYITNEARSILLEGIIQTVADGNEFIYADTDSIVFIENNPSSLPIGDELGEWKVEGKFNFFSRPLVKKKYLLEGKNAKGQEAIKIAVSGFSKDLVMNVMTTEQRRLLFNPKVNILWRRAKNHSTLNSLFQILIDPIDVETNEAIPITHELILKNDLFILKEYARPS